MAHDMEFSWGETDEWILAVIGSQPYNGAPLAGVEAKRQLHPSKLGSSWSGLAGQSMKQKRLADAIMAVVEQNVKDVTELLPTVRGGRGLVRHSHSAFKDANGGLPGYAAALRAYLAPGSNSTIAKAALAFQYCYGICVGCTRAKQAFLTTPVGGIEVPQFYLLPEHRSSSLDLGWPELAAYCSDCKVRCVGCKKNGVVFGMMSDDLRSFAAERLCEACRSGRLVEVKAPTFDRSVAKRLSRSRYIMVD